MTKMPNPIDSIIKDFEKDFAYWFNYIEVHTGTSERENVRKWFAENFPKYCSQVLESCLPEERVIELQEPRLYQVNSECNLCGHSEVCHESSIGKCNFWINHFTVCDCVGFISKEKPEWEEEFDNLKLKENRDVGYHCKDCEKVLKDFIRQLIQDTEKRKDDEWRKTMNSGKRLYEIGKEEARKEERERLLNQKANQHDQEIIQSERERIIKIGNVAPENWVYLLGGMIIGIIVSEVWTPKN